MQFVLMKESFTDRTPFPSIVGNMTGGELCSQNTSIILRKGLLGKELVMECIEYIFSMHELCPVVELGYCQRLGFQTLEKIF
jgi:hypothetical protein